jgi:multicomponent K+:H+ antiporter subunit F
MSAVLTFGIGFAIGCYVLAMAIVLYRLFAGPAAQDRIMALDFMYICGMLVVLVVGIRYGSEMYFEVALLIALFGFVSSSAMAKFLLRGEVIE